jgi:predicted phosphoribosyltransferase
MQRRSTSERIVERPDLRDRPRVFHDRTHAGEVLASLLKAYRGREAVILAVPAGGVPVAAAIAHELDLPLDVAVVSKVTLPWNSEAGYGAVAFDGTVKLNEGLLSRLQLTREEIQEGIRATTQKVHRRVRSLQGERSFPDLSDRPTILVDDGLASGFTMLVAIEAVRNAGASEAVVAVPTGHLEAVHRIVHEVEAVYCANVRGGWQFAVADAYEHWSDVDEEEAARILDAYHQGFLNKSTKPKDH